MSSVQQPSGVSLLEEDSGIVDVGWEFDENGEMVETIPAAKAATTWPPNEDVTGTKMRTDFSLVTKAREESADGIWAFQRVRNS